jgi:putative FmdB family regulatory protein
MPIYEYECAECHRRTSVLTTRVGERVRPVCKHCGCRRLARVMSRFAMPRSEERRLDALADSSALGDLDENDPKSVAKMMRKLGKEMGDEAGPEFDQAVEELESGKLGNDDGEGDLGGDED